MKVRYSPRAFADRETIFEYLSQRSPSGARNVMASIRETVTLLREQPYSGHRTELSDVRVIFVRRYPYKIFYRVGAEAVDIVHIRHTARRAFVSEP
jgi:addiction module RelE/StbE family toxin